MKEQSAIKVEIPSTVADLHLDFHGVPIKLLRFELNDLNTGADVEEKVLYLAIDKYGDLNWYQYLPVADKRNGDFDLGHHPDNALDAGNYDLISVPSIYSVEDIPVEWYDSCIKYTIK